MNSSANSSPSSAAESIARGLASVARRFGPVGGAAAQAIEIYGEGAGILERLALRALPIGGPDAGAAGSAGKLEPGESSPAGLMTTLLERSLRQNESGSRREYHVWLLRQLVPDQARILAALAENRPAPLVHIDGRGSGERILENASLIGRTAALTLPRLTPAYITHLRQLGLVEHGPADPGIEKDYELLLADRDVRAALAQGKLSKFPARVIRRTLRLSPRGRELWEATRGDEGD